VGGIVATVPIYETATMLISASATFAGTSEVNGDILRAEFNFLCKNNYIDRGLLNHEKWRPPKSIWWVLVASRLGSVDFAAQSRLTWLG
jgi:hypothetical protein